MSEYKSTAAQQTGNVHKENKGKRGSDLIRCMLFEPGKEPKETYVNRSLESLQLIVDGWIEQLPLFYVVGDGLYLLCNEDAKLKKSCAANRVFCNKDTGDPISVIRGTFLIVGMGSGDYRSLTDEEVRMVKGACGKTIL